MLLISAALALPVLTDEMRNTDRLEQIHQRQQQELLQLETAAEKACPATRLTTQRWGSAAPSNLAIQPTLAKELCVVDAAPKLRAEIACLNQFNAQRIDAYLTAQGWTLHEEQPLRVVGSSPDMPVAGTTFAPVGETTEPRVVAGSHLVSAYLGAANTLTQTTFLRQVRTATGESALVQLSPTTAENRTTVECTAWAGPGMASPPQYAVYTLPATDAPVPSIQGRSLPLTSIVVQAVDTESLCCRPSPPRGP